MVVGMIPLLRASGAGASSRYSIGLVIAAGMLIGTMFTLFVTPAVYTYIARDRTATRPAEGEAPQSTPAVPHPAE
jgi:Cu/Ag efflux pump CusA